MQDLIQAASAAAARQGIQVAVMVFGSGGNGQHATVEHEHYHHTEGTPPYMGPDQEPSEEERHVHAGQAQQDQERIFSLRDQMTQVATARDSALRQNEQLGSQLREAQAEIAQLQAAPPPAAAIAVAVSTGAPTAEARAPEQPTVMLDHDALGIETLNLPEKVAKVCGKNEIKTIGQLREFFPKLGEAKINQKERITTAEILMGYIASPNGAQAAPAALAASTGATDVPAGFTDRTWAERIKIARFKEGKDASVREKVASLIVDVRNLIPDAPDPTSVRGEQYWRETLSALVSGTTTDKPDAALMLGSYISERLVHEVTNAQIAAVLYCLGFDPKESDQRTVDSALTAHGLAHLSESVPATAGV